MSAAHLVEPSCHTGAGLITSLVMNADGSAASVRTLRNDATLNEAEATIYRFRALPEPSQRIAAQLEVEAFQG